MNKVIIQTNEEEFEKLICKYNFLVDELNKTIDELKSFKLEIVSIPKCEL